MDKLHKIDNKLHGKVAIITGANRSSGLGFKIAKTLYKHGCSIVVTAYNDIKSLDIYDEFTDPDRILKLKLDIKSRDSIKRIINKTIDKFGKIDILVNNAGIHQVKPFLEITDDDWDLIMGTNLRGTFIMCQECIPHMDKHSKIINIGSIAGSIGGCEAGAYAISKTGLIGLTKTLAKCFPEINSNCVAPSLIKTDMADGLKCDGRIGQPSDVANTVVFLACDDANFITGQTININGGLYFN